MTHRIARGAAVAAIMIAVSFGLLHAHATVSPPTSRPGAYERYTVRVPNESNAPTTSVSITFPTEVRVISFVDVPGWTVSARMDDTDRALSATWTGSLPPHRFVELPFIGVNPAEPVTVAWPVVQVYANGDTVRWTGAPESDTPASRTVIGAAAGAADDDGFEIDDVLIGAVAGAALVLSIIALVRSRARP